jgi:phage major head subunit gpT-like protein
MPNLDNALQQLREEHKQAQLRVEKLYQAISVIESLDGSGAYRKGTRPTRIVSAASRRKMARAQRARWARVKAHNVIPIVSTRGKRTISAAGRRRIAAAQRARWAKVRAGKK